MKDLIISHTTNGKESKVEYDTIMDFMDSFESGEINSDSFTNIDATFFENSLNTKSFSNAEKLYNHCKSIVS